MEDTRALISVDGTYHQGTIWFTQSQIEFDLNLRDGRDHQIAVYLVRLWAAERQERIEVIDAASRQLLEQQTIADIPDGVYVVLNVRGHIILRVVRDSEAQCVASGFFLDPVQSHLEEWRSGFFGQAGASSPEIGGDKADPDHDGLPNYLEYALGLDPTEAADGQPFSQPAIHGNAMEISFVGQVPPAGVSVTVESSSNLIDWQSVPKQNDRVDIVSLPYGLQRTTYTFDLTSTSRRYLRWLANPN